MSNHLVNERSLYLLQHAHNPVDWYPWGPAALEKARLEDKPLLVSIGYSACHWCHVMAHESFENPQIAEIMNRLFVCIKVDREERPDIDKIYMDAIQMLSGHGGWPLNAFCLPDGRPFTGGTYFPPDDRRGRQMTWPMVLAKVSQAYQNKRSELDKISESLLSSMKLQNSIIPPQGHVLDFSLMEASAQQILSTHDHEFGGLGQAPKFPPSMALMFLLSIRDQVKAQQAASIDACVKKSLEAMALGGIFDQIGGGFARYSVDKYWKIPHFEKMLYDNALLIEVYTQAWARYREPLYEAIVAETIGWLQREMQSQTGGFAASLDADTEHEEGLTYVWTPTEVKNILGEGEGAAFCEAYEITNDGNFEHGKSNPHLQSPDFAVRQSFKSARERLLNVRQARPQPGKDTKKLVAWNSMLAKALVEAGFTFSKPEWTLLGKDVVDWIWNTCRVGADQLHSVVYESTPKFNGNLDDYVFYTGALLAVSSKVDWLTPGLSSEYLDKARQLLTYTLEHFGEGNEPGCFFTSDNHEQLVHRHKTWFDSAIPSANSELVHCLATINARLEEPRFQIAYEELRKAFIGMTERAPSGVCYALAGFSEDSRAVVVKVNSPSQIAEVQRILTLKPWRKACIVVDEELGGEMLVCKGKSCSADLASLDTSE